MSDELNQLRRQLEQATSAEVPPDVSLDDQTRSLRQTWLALGQLLETAQPAPDEPLQLRPMPRRTVRSRWRLAAVAVLAASLLVGVALALSWLGRTPSGQIATPKSSQDKKSARPEEEQRPPAVVEDQADEWDWDDSLDEQIAMAGQEVVLVQQGWHDLDDAFGSVQVGLEEIEEDIQDETL